MLDRKHKFRLDCSPEEMAERIKRGDLQIHQFADGFAITEIRQFTTEKICFVCWLFGKNFDSWKSDVVESINKLAKAEGCIAIEAACRFGLEGSLKDLGFRRSQIILRKEVT